MLAFSLPSDKVSSDDGSGRRQRRRFGADFCGDLTNQWVKVRDLGVVEVEHRQPEWVDSFEQALFEAEDHRQSLPALTRIVSAPVAEATNLLDPQNLTLKPGLEPVDKFSINAEAQSGLLFFEGDSDPAVLVSERARPTFWPTRGTRGGFGEAARPSRQLPDQQARALELAATQRGFDGGGESLVLARQNVPVLSDNVGSEPVNTNRSDGERQSTGKG